MLQNVEPTGVKVSLGSNNPEYKAFLVASNDEHPSGEAALGRLAVTACRAVDGLLSAQSDGGALISRCFAEGSLAVQYTAWADSAIFRKGLSVAYNRSDLNKLANAREFIAECPIFCTLCNNYSAKCTDSDRQKPIDDIKTRVKALSNPKTQWSLTSATFTSGEPQKVELFLSQIAEALLPQDLAKLAIGSAIDSFKEKRPHLQHACSLLNAALKALPNIQNDSKQRERLIQVVGHLLLSAAADGKRGEVAKAYRGFFSNLGGKTLSHDNFGRIVGEPLAEATGSALHTLTLLKDARSAMQLTLPDMTKLGVADALISLCTVPNQHGLPSCLQQAERSFPYQVAERALQGAIKDESQGPSLFCKAVLCGHGGQVLNRLHRLEDLEVFAVLAAQQKISGPFFACLEGYLVKEDLEKFCQASPLPDVLLDIVPSFSSVLEKELDAITENLQALTNSQLAQELLSQIKELRRNLLGLAKQLDHLACRKAVDADLSKPLQIANAWNKWVSDNHGVVFFDPVSTSNATGVGDVRVYKVVFSQAKLLGQEVKRGSKAMVFQVHFYDSKKDPDHQYFPIQCDNQSIRDLQARGIRVGRAPNFDLVLHRRTRRGASTTQVQRRFRSTLEDIVKKDPALKRILDKQQALRGKDKS